MIRPSKKIKLSSNEENTYGAFRCNSEFFNVSCEKLAKSLLGTVLTRCIDGCILKGRIVETECYLGGIDKASHSYNNRRTDRNEPMYMQAGTAYVYMTYGMYFCFNISSAEPGAAVLVRAVEPLENTDKMISIRYKGKSAPQKFKTEHLCNGPAKLCMSFGINKNTCNKVFLGDSDVLWIESCEGNKSVSTIIKSKRVGIDSAGLEWASKLLRFYIYGNKCVSKRDKSAEKELECSAEK